VAASAAWVQRRRWSLKGRLNPLVDLWGESLSQTCKSTARRRPTKSLRLKTRSQAGLASKMLRRKRIRERRTKLPRKPRLNWSTRRKSVLWFKERIAVGVQFLVLILRTCCLAEETGLKSKGSTWRTKRMPPRRRRRQRDRRSVTWSRKWRRSPPLNSFKRRGKNWGRRRTRSVLMTSPPAL